MEKKQILSKKNYSKYDRQFMAFGSMANALQGYLAKQESDERVFAVLGKVWNKSTELVGGFVDTLYDANDKEVLTAYENPTKSL
jgi:hypothetical protein